MAFFVFDLDGTLARIDHRRHFILQPVKDHRAFYAACDQDMPNQPVIDALHAHLAVGHRVEIWSGRSDEVRDKTEAWLAKHDINPALLTRMRAAGDYTKDHILKRSWLIDSAERPSAIYDDRPSVVAMWRREGVACFQVDAGDWDDTSRRRIEPGRSGQCLILMVGPSGAGKSLYASVAFDPTWIIESDTIRQQLCGDFRDQSRNADVFETVRRIAVARLKSGLSCVIDATHLRRRDRIAHASLAPAGVTCHYVVCDRPIDEKIRDGGWRNDVMVRVGDRNISLIEKHDQHFHSELANIMAGDDLPHVVVDDRRAMVGAAA